MNPFRHKSVDRKVDTVLRENEFHSLIGIYALTAENGWDEIRESHKAGKETRGIGSCPHSPLSSGVTKHRLASPTIRHIRQRKEAVHKHPQVKKIIELLLHDSSVGLYKELHFDILDCFHYPRLHT